MCMSARWHPPLAPIVWEFAIGFQTPLKVIKLTTGVIAEPIHDSLSSSAEREAFAATDRRYRSEFQPLNFPRYDQVFFVGDRLSTRSC